MKTKSAKIKSKNTRAKLNFVRVFPFYVSHPKGGFFFQATVKVFQKLDLETGMSVNLTELDSISKKIFKNQSLKNQSVQFLLSAITEKLRVQLDLKKIELVSVQFDEIRGIGFLLKNKNLSYIRKDMAIDKAGTLFGITSYFNEKNEITQIILKNLKLDLTEHLLFN